MLRRRHAIPRRPVRRPRAPRALHLARLMGVGRRATVRIEARGLTKRYGETVAVDNLSFDVLPGQVT